MSGEAEGMSERILNIGVLASGTGTNLQSIIDSCESGRIRARVRAVASDIPSSGALDRARRHGIPSAAIERGAYPTKAAFEGAIVDFLKGHGVELVCLAGYMRIVGRTLLGAFPGMVVNIHPALLPSFPGLRAQRQALEYGVKVSGCTVHFVDELVDHGPIIMQAAVPVMEDDTEDTLAARILEQEHRIYPEAIDLIARGMARVEGRRVRISGKGGDR